MKCPQSEVHCCLLQVNKHNKRQLLCADTRVRLPAGGRGRGGGGGLALITVTRTARRRCEAVLLNRYGTNLKKNETLKWNLQRLSV